MAFVVHLLPRIGAQGVDLLLDSFCSFCDQQHLSAIKSSPGAWKANLITVINRYNKERMWPLWWETEQPLTFLPCLHDAWQCGDCYLIKLSANLTATLGGRFYCYSHLTGEEIKGTEKRLSYCPRYTAIGGGGVAGGVWLQSLCTWTTALHQRGWVHCCERRGNYRLVTSKASWTLLLRTFSFNCGKICVK